jgi:predicted DNA-binding protein
MNDAQPDTSSAAGRMVVTSICLPPELSARVQQAAHAQRRSVSNLIRGIIEDNLPDNAPISITGSQR